GAFKGYRGIGRDITAHKRAEDLHQLEHAIARALAEATNTSEGVRDALRLVCEAEGWDAGRCFRVDPSSGEAKYSEGWFAREADIEQLLRGSRVLWQPGKPVWSTDLPRTGRAAARGVAKSGGHFATFALPVPSPQGTIALLAFSGHTTREPDASFLDAVPAIGRLFAQFLQRKSAEESLRESEARFRSLTQLSSDFFWESDAQHRLSNIVHGPSYVSPIGYGLLGRTPWELASVRPDEAGWQAHRATLDSRLPFREVEVAQRLRRNVRASDLVARLGGDEFFVVLEAVQDLAGVERVVVKIIDALRRPYPGIGEATRRVSATLGISIFPDDAPDATMLVEHADEAMYTAKQAGKNAYCLYSTGHKPPAGAPAAPSTAPQP